MNILYCKNKILEGAFVLDSITLKQKDDHEIVVLKSESESMIYDFETGDGMRFYQDISMPLKERMFGIMLFERANRVVLFIHDTGLIGYFNPI